MGNIHCLPNPWYLLFLLGFTLSVPYAPSTLFTTNLWAGANQPVHWFLGDKGVGIQQGTSVWVDSPKSNLCWKPEKKVAT